MKPRAQSLTLFALLLMAFTPVALSSDHHDEHGHEMRQQGTHVHGQATLRLAIEDNTLVMELESPAMNIVGFEHAPEDTHQKDQLANAAKTLADHRHVATIQGGDCQQQQAKVQAPYGQDSHEDQHDHADFELSYQLSCKKSDEIEAIEITAFQHFPGLEGIRIEWVSETGQGSQMANKDQNVIRLK